MQGKINRHTDHPAGRHSIRANQCPPPPSPYIFTGRTPSCRPTNSVTALTAYYVTMLLNYCCCYLVVQIYHINNLSKYHSMLRIGAEMLPPAPDSIGGSITEANKLRPNVFCSLASWIFFSNACSAARRRLDGGSNCTQPRNHAVFIYLLHQFNVARQSQHTVNNTIT